MNESDASSRAVPAPSSLTQPYWDSAALGTLAIQRCDACRRFVHPPRPQCPACESSDLSFEPVSGRGRLETFSVVHRTFAPGFSGRVPYVIAWVELEEQAGLRVFTNISAVPPDDLEVDMAVEVDFVHLDGFGAVPEFRPTAAANQNQGD